MGNSNEAPKRRPLSASDSVHQYQDEFLWKIPIVGDIGAGKVSSNNFECCTRTDKVGIDFYYEKSVYFSTWCSLLTNV